MPLKGVVKSGQANLRRSEDPSTLAEMEITISDGAVTGSPALGWQAYVQSAIPVLGGIGVLTLLGQAAIENGTEALPLSLLWIALALLAGGPFCLYLMRERANRCWPIVVGLIRSAEAHKRKQGKPEEVRHGDNL